MSPQKAPLSWRKAERPKSGAPPRWQSSASPTSAELAATDTARERITTAGQSVQSGDVLEIIGQIERLPTPPVVFSQINRVLTNPQASAYDLARIIAEDPATSARVLRMANSAYYGLDQPVVSVRQAVVILGMEAIRSVVLSSAMMEAFGGIGADDEYQENF